MAENSKAQEALQETEETTVPPPAYKERASVVVETDDFQIVEAQDAISQDTMSQEEKRAVAGPSAAPQLEEQTSVHRTPSMLKEKGPAYPPRPSNPIPHSDEAPAIDKEDAIAPVVENQDPPTALPTAEDEKKALQVHFAEEEEVPPTLPRRPTVTRFSEDFSHDNTNPNIAPPVLPQRHEAPGGVPLTYTFAWHRPILDFATLHITPTNNTTIPSSFPDIPATASWRLNYQSKYLARLHRYTAAQAPVDKHTSQAGDFPFRQIAEIKFPEFIIPGAGCGATVKFEPHEEELARLGNVSGVNKPAHRIQKFMQCAGWLSTRYSMEAPVLDHLQATWKTLPRPRTTTRNTSDGIVESRDETAIVSRKTSDIEREARKRNVRLITLGDLLEQARKTLHDETWTPYAPQQLLIEFDGRPVATYQRASPWAKHAGVLTIRQPEVGQVSVTPEFVEGIVIATAAMVGMQDRIGLASGLMEAANSSSKWGLDVADKSASWSAEQWKRAQREWKARRAGSRGGGGAAGASGGGGGVGVGPGGQVHTHPYGNSAARAQGEKALGEEEEVGSEIFDDGLAGVLSVEEREAARREQLAWDERQQQQQQRVRFIDTTTTGRLEPRDELARETLSWEKPKVVYA